MSVNKKDLEKDIKKWVDSYAKTYCHKAAKEITRFAKNAIDLFYSQYEPKFYNRMDDLKNNSYTPYYHNNGRIVYGGVLISANKMQPYNGAGITKEEIAMGTWRHGLHGFENHNPSEKIHTYPPIVMVQLAMNDKKFLDNLDKYASMIARKQKYTSLNF